ncbi:Putative major facilitator superfamily, MFS transporter superfamily [Septoria linicola]|uniref:Major facilitator superfamily, MFS transporter superfamily n=1 Tax=Septoria linicola TaxID=215465 RepID=A0A9Q9B3N7_9PEZI|nr:putative major facilitator superfamily, MFS transporter superfamily [Septoria linicola]USW56938.1 Putative major facilitator superfamily, MFS transporter superfamily [Septoria linicola]
MGVWRRMFQSRCITAFATFRSSTAWITFVVAFSVYTDQFLYAAIVPVTPFALAERGHISEDQIQFWTTILLAAFGAGIFVSSPPWARYTDHSKNRRMPFLLGLLALLGATVLLWLAPNIATQIVGKVLQGVAGTVVWTTGLAILVETVSAEHIGEASGYVGIALNAGSVTAPLLGGVVFERHGYNTVFGLILSQNLPLSEGTLVDEEACSHDSKNEAGVQITEIDHSRSTTSREQHPLSVHPRLPAMIRLLFSIRFLVALWGVFTLAAVYSGFETVLPITVHQLFDWNAEGSRLIFLPLAIPSLAGPLLGKLTDKYSGRWFVAGSFLTLCPALVLLRLISHNSMKQERAAGFVGFGRRKGYYGQAYGYFNMAWALGNTVGPILCGFIAENQGWATATMALGILAGVTAIPVVLYCDGRLFSVEDKVH